MIQIFNVGAERMLGYSAGEVMNKITPADISDPQELITRAKALSLELGASIHQGDGKKHRSGTLDGLRESGGTIWVYSELGLGTTFKVYQCLSRGDELAKPRSNRPAPALAFSLPK